MGDAVERTVLVSKDNSGVATVTLNRPSRMNAFTRAMWGELASALAELSRAADVRCVVLRGAGGEAFSAGADIAEFESERGSAAMARDYGAVMHAATAAVAGSVHPTVAAIQGVCTGAGLVVAARCDLRLCGEASRFGVPVSRIGINMPYPELAALHDLAGRATTLEMVLEGRIIDAEEALAKGLVNRVVSDSELDAAVAETAARIAAGAPLANRRHKAMVRRLAEPRPPTEREIADSFSCFDTEDCREGHEAFLDKREPAFRGR